ncbi:hypothetical protein LCGC14_1412930, partial [marine sediment metagenome]
MATHFRRDARKQKAPSWCRPGLFPAAASVLAQLNAPPPAWVQGLPPVLFAIFGLLPPAIAAAIVALPARLVIFTYWLDLNVDPPIDITAAFPTTWDATLPGWSGTSA